MTVVTLGTSQPPWAPQGPIQDARAQKKAEVVTILVDTVQESFFDNEKSGAKMGWNRIQHQLLSHLRPSHSQAFHRSSGCRGCGGLTGGALSICKRWNQNMSAFEMTEHTFALHAHKETAWSIICGQFKVKVRSQVFSGVNHIFLMPESYKRFMLIEKKKQFKKQFGKTEMSKWNSSWEQSPLCFWYLNKVILICHKAAFSDFTEVSENKKHLFSKTKHPSFLNVVIGCIKIVLIGFEIINLPNGNKIMLKKPALIEKTFFALGGGGFLPFSTTVFMLLIFHFLVAGFALTSLLNRTRVHLQVNQNPHF